MGNTCVILPIKTYRRAKTRLRPVLSAAQCATVARLMAMDMLETLASVPAIDRVLIVGQGDDQAKLAKMHGCDYAADDPALDVSANLTRMARQLAQEGTETLLYIPSDLGFATAADVSRLLGNARRGITLCRAIRDGGTNALVASPPGKLTFSFGAGSAERHVRIARAEGRAIRVLDDVAFQRDIDVPADLIALCRHEASGALTGYLHDSGIAGKLMALCPETKAS